MSATQTVPSRPLSLGERECLCVQILSHTKARLMFYSPDNFLMTSSGTVTFFLFA